MMENTIPITNLNMVGGLFRLMNIDCGVRPPDNMQGQYLEKGKRRGDRNFTFQWLATLTSCVWLVHLTCHNITNHSICIDGEKIIITITKSRTHSNLALNIYSCAGA